MQNFTVTIAHCYRLLGFFSLLMVSVSCMAEVGEQHEVALAMVHKLQLGKDLPLAGYTIATSTSTYHTIAGKVGQERADDLIKQELVRLIPKYRKHWNGNLADAHAEFLSVSAMASITARQETSPDYKELAVQQAAIAKSMQARSVQILNTYVAEALRNASLKAAQN